ncbi:MAG TPA: hypothetical protein VHU16_07355 [Candidatus Udaeobacter sp.]|jgi:hypothetical protein|nr:hypothetical protein [Candidatus Udaeobacter sp.]
MASAANAASKRIGVALNHAARWLNARVPQNDRATRALLMLGVACTTPNDEETLDRLTQMITPDDAVASAFVLRAAVRKLSRRSRARARLDSLLGSGTPPPPLTWLRALDDDTLPYVAPPDLVRQIATSITLVTDFGTRRRTWPPALVDTLTFWLFCSMRDDDLDLLCPLVRALSFLGCPDIDEFHDAIAFILRHQREDGRFSAQELSLLQCSRKNAEFDLLRDAYLPMTVASVWTLTEAHD